MLPVEKPVNHGQHWNCFLCRKFLRSGSYVNMFSGLCLTHIPLDICRCTSHQCWHTCAGNHVPGHMCLTLKGNLPTENQLSLIKQALPCMGTSNTSHSANVGSYVSMFFGLSSTHSPHDICKGENHPFLHKRAGSYVLDHMYPNLKRNTSSIHSYLP